MPQKGISIEEARKAGVNVKTPVDQEEVNRLALKILGLLAEASSTQTRRRAIEKAGRMIKTK